ncbi:uncharacterized protein arhgef5 isoform X1 [Genypterus blacodes]|uniref:uncharacterized protein arhgef5 isoform X1 n=1 Tax=Genypterus blacodes TaxID=154954 RepID=UPI003F75BAF5
MGTKRPNWTLLDTLSNINMTDRKHQPGGKTTRDPSPRPGMTAQSERERDRNQEGEWRRESEMEKMRDKTRHKGKELDPREQYSERDCAPVPTREGEREWRERQKRREADRRRNGRPISNLETKPAKDIEGKMKKGDTFPRMRKERYTAKDEDIGVKRQMDRQRRVEVDDWERKREGTWQRDRDTEREQPRERERGDTQSRAKGVEDGRVERRERRREAEPGRRERDLGVSDLPGRRERDATRKREKLRPDEGKKKARFPSPFRRRDRENYSDEERGKAQRTEERRDTRSEGDTDETEIKRERARDRQREEMIYQHSKSEGDNKGELAKERDRNRSREEDRPRYRQGDAETSKRPSDGRERGAEKDKERYRDNDRRPVRDGERWKDRHDDRARPDDRRVAGLHGERTHDKRRDRGGRGREAEHRYDNATGRSSRPPSETAARVPPRAQSSGEWSSDMDSERRSRQGRDSYEERELGRDSTDRNERDVEETTGSDRAGERRWKEQKRGERPDRQGGQGRKMWLEPKGKNSKESSLEEEVVQTETCKRQSEEARSMESHGMGEGWRVKEEQDERYLDKSDSRGRRYDTETSRRQEYKDQGGEAERETEGVSLEEEEVGEARRKRDKAEEEHLSDSDGGEEGGWFRDAERENATDDTEESDTEEEEGSDYCARCGSEGVSEAGSDRDRMLSTGDSFVTVSSGGDGEDEREEEEFQDCSEFLEGGVPPAGFRQREGDDEWRGRKEERVEENEEGKVKHSKYVYCVIGQTLPRSKSNQMPQLDQVGGAESNNPNLESSYGGNDVTQRPQHDLHLTVSGGDEHTTNNPSNNEATEEGTFGDETSRADVRYRASSQGHDTETGKRSEVKVEHPYAVIGPTSRDSQTEKLLVQWRERNKDLAEENKEGLLSHPDNPCAEIQDPFVGIDTRTMTPEEEEAIRIRMSGAWSISEEPKRHSQAPHLKWAKNVVCEILGSSDEKTIDDPSSGSEGDQCANWPKAAIEKDKQGEESTDGIGEMPFYASVQKPRIEEEPTEPGSDEEEPELEGLRGMGQSKADTHAVQYTAIHGDTPTYTHADTLLDSEREADHCAATDNKTEPSGQLQFEKAAKDIEVRIVEETDTEVTEMEREDSEEKEVEGYLTVSNVLYKPNSCPSLNYEESDHPNPSVEVQVQEVWMSQSDEEKQAEEPGDMGTDGLEEKESLVKGAEEKEEEEGLVGGGFVQSSCSFRDLGPEARFRRRGIRKTTARRKTDCVEEEEEEEGDEAVGRDRRTRIFSTSDDEDCRSKSWGELDLRSVMDTLTRRRRNSKFFNAAQLYQQYSEAAQNIEILRQSRSDTLSVCYDTTQLPALSPSSSPIPSPPPARRPLPPLPPVPHPHSLAHTGSLTSAKTLPLPEPPSSGRRSSSPRLSVSLTQSSTLWRELPGVRNSVELEELTEDQRRLQEVRFEVVTSEASYCRSLDIVVEHFVKSKQLGTLLTTQDRNWLFSRLADVRAISHNFLSKLEERVDSDIFFFTVCDIIARQCQRFRMVYVPYLTNQSYQDATYQRLMNVNPGFKRIVEKLERSAVCQRLPLRSFLVLPFQRITRIKLLVQNIVKRTTPGTPESMQAIKALKLLEKLIQESNDSITQMKSIESLVSLSAKVDFECRTLPLISQARRLVREGSVTELMDFSLKDTERNIYLHLFNDYLLVSLQKEGGKLTVIDHAPVSDLRAENCRVKLHSLKKNLFRLHLTQKALLLRTETLSDKLRWISAVSLSHPEIDFSAAQDFEQMQCIRAFIAQQPDELSLEKADIILVHQQSTDGWVEGTKLSDRHRGWIRVSHLETITNNRVRQRNLSDALKLTTATAAV